VRAFFVLSACPLAGLLRLTVAIDGPVSEVHLSALHISVLCPGPPVPPFLLPGFLPLGQAAQPAGAPPGCAGRANRLLRRLPAGQLFCPTSAVVCVSVSRTCESRAGAAGSTSAGDSQLQPIELDSDADEPTAGAAAAAAVTGVLDGPFGVTTVSQMNDVVFEQVAAENLAFVRDVHLLDADYFRSAVSKARH
jgi:hypothetical protein